MVINFEYPFPSYNWWLKKAKSDTFSRSRNSSGGRMPSKYQQAVRDLQITLTALLRNRCPTPPDFNFPIAIAFVWHMPNMRSDLDNIAFNRKYIIDTLVKEEWLPNDNPLHINGLKDRFVLERGLEIPRCQITLPTVRNHARKRSK